MDNIRELYVDWAMDYCNNYFKDDEEYPAGFQLAIDELIKHDPLQFNVASQKLHDMSINYNDNGTTGIPRYILFYLEPYRKLKSV